ncbi:type II secretion system protein N [Ramlibacter sp. GTP1]|uniref:Type II secretion system protein N n=1 Tax=Ramlibacter albus TaxID=2079448 RepID=A0A923S219_9BURK|nr:type II secretion system protein N [Ramlibacter albus]
MDRPARWRWAGAGARPPTRSGPVAAPWGWAAAGGVLGLLLAIVVFAPATWLASALESSTNGHLRLDDPRGTVWDGSARLVLTGGIGSQDATALPGRVQWRLRPRFNGVAAQLRSECCAPEPIGMRLRVRLGGAHVDIADAASQWPAALLAGLGTPWNTLQIDGDLRLATQGLSLEWAEGRLAVAGRAELVAQRVASRLSTLRPMGSYRITLEGGAAPTLRLETLEGSLRLQGQGQWVGSRLRFAGEATAEPEREGALSNLLNIIGRRNGPRSIITIG